MKTNTSTLEANLSVEPVVAKVQRRIDGLEGFKVNGHFLFFVLISQDSTAIDHKTIWRHLVSRIICTKQFKGEFQFLGGGKVIYIHLECEPRTQGSEHLLY
jgi:hypothetical protein